MNVTTLRTEDGRTIVGRVASVIPSGGQNAAGLADLPQAQSISVGRVVASVVGNAIGTGLLFAAVGALVGGTGKRKATALTGAKWGAGIGGALGLLNGLSAQSSVAGVPQ